MKNTFTDDQKELTDRLVKAGIEEKVAKCLVMIATHDEVGRRDIEDATGLSQSRISVGTQKLREWGWADKRKIPREGKGRPFHAYYLDKSIEKIIEDIEEEERERIEEIEENIEKIKKLTDSAV